MWEILDEKEAELIGEIMNLKKKEKEYINQIAISADACAIRSDEIKYDMELMESQIKNLEVLSDGSYKFFIFITYERFFKC